MDWLHCNKCYALRSDGPFWFTSCGHIICDGCVDGTMMPNQKGPCIVCQMNASILEINRSMRSDLLSLFRSPKELLVQHTANVKSVLEFQNSQRVHLTKYLQSQCNKAGSFVQNAKLKIAKLNAHEKQLVAEHSQTKAELMESQAYIHQLENKLAVRDQELQDLMNQQQQQPLVVRDQELQDLMNPQPLTSRRSPRKTSPRKASSRKTSPRKVNQSGFPSLDGHTPIASLSFLGCTTSTPAGLMSNARRQIRYADGLFGSGTENNTYEESPLAGGPNRDQIPSTPQLLGTNMRTSSEANKSKNYF